MKRAWVACLVAGLIAITGLLIANAVNSGNVCVSDMNGAKIETISKSFTLHAPIWIDGNADFSDVDDDGVSNPGAAGTESDPYIIENWDINASTANGIELRNTNVYFVIRNCTIHDGKSNHSYGIYFYNVMSGEIENVINYNNYHGVYLSASSNNNISACTIYSNSWAGIYLFSASNNNAISGCNIYNNSWTGIYHSSSSNNNISACNIYNNSDDGIYLWDSSNNNQIINCNVYNNSHGIWLSSSSNSNQITNCKVYNNSYGLWLSSSSNNNVTSCTVYNNSYGISINSSLNNQIINCAIYKNSYGIRTSSAENTIIESCTILDNTNVGVDIYYLTTYIINSSIAGSLNDTFLHKSTTAKCINATFTTVFVDENSTLVRSWYLDVNVTDVHNNMILYANVRVKDAHNNHIGDFSTGMCGVAQNIPCVAYTQNSTGKDYSMNNHNATVGNRTHPVNVSGNIEITIKAWYFSVSSPVIDRITYEDYTIIQENNLTFAEGGSLTLKTVILKMNCSYNGSLVIEVSSGAEMYILNNSNITSANPNYHYLFWVRNGSKFEMRDSGLSECGWEWGGTMELAGLWVNANNTIFENDIISNNGGGIIFHQSNNNIITNTNITNNDIGIFLDASSNNSISNCKIYSNNWQGVFGSSVYGLSNNNTIANCNIWDNLYGLILGYSSNNTIINCNISNNDVVGISLESSSYNNIINCVLSENWYGIDLQTMSDNNHITNCVLQANQADGITIASSINNVITGSTITSSNQGISVISSSGLTISYCNVASNNYSIICGNSSATIQNSTITNSSNYDFDLVNGAQLIALNTTFNKTKVHFEDNLSTIDVSWYLNVIVLWNNSVPAEGANLGIQDNVNGTFDENYTTDETGWIRNIIAQEYTQNQTNTTYFTPYNVNASQASFWNSTSIPVTNTMARTLYLNQPFPHNAPAITDTFPNLEYSFNENITTEFKFNISHPNNLTLTYRWYLDNIEVKNGTLEDTSAVQVLDFTYYFNYTSSGTHKIKITVSDGNATVSRTWTLTVININAPPVIIEFSPTGSCMSITEEQNVSFCVTAEDVDGNPLSYWWYIYYENISVPVEQYGGVNGNNTIIFGPFDTTGNYTVEIKVYETYNQSSIATHTWLLKVWNITELMNQMALLQGMIDNLNNTVNNLSANITDLNDIINSLRDDLANLTALYNNLSAQISNLTSERDNALNDKSIAENRTAQAEKEKEEAIDAMHTAQYRLAASVVGAVIAGVFAGAFVFSLLLRKKKGSK